MSSAIVARVGQQHVAGPTKVLQLFCGALTQVGAHLAHRSPESGADLGRTRAGAATQQAARSQDVPAAGRGGRIAHISGTT